MDCICCGRQGPGDAAHVVTASGQKGMALKVDDRQCVPLCRRCHRYYDGQADGPRNPFRHWTKDEKRDVAIGWVATVSLAAFPESRDEARDLEDAGLGWVEEIRGGWVWMVGERPAGSEAA